MSLNIASWKNVAVGAFALAVVLLPLQSTQAGSDHEASASVSHPASEPRSVPPTPKTYENAIASLRPFEDKALGLRYIPMHELPSNPEAAEMDKVSGVTEQKLEVRYGPDFVEGLRQAYLVPEAQRKERTRPPELGPEPLIFVNYAVSSDPYSAVQRENFLKLAHEAAVKYQTPVVVIDAVAFNGTDPVYAGDLINLLKADDNMILGDRGHTYDVEQYPLISAFQVSYRGKPLVGGSWALFSSIAERQLKKALQSHNSTMSESEIAERVDAAVGRGVRAKVTRALTSVGNGNPQDLPRKAEESPDHTSPAK